MMLFQVFCFRFGVLQADNIIITTALSLCLKYFDSVLCLCVFGIKGIGRPEIKIQPYCDACVLL